jgi:dihydrofolate synthase/folylpolyglutamate synthase
LRDRFPGLIDLSTSRILRLLEALGRPQDRLPPVVHVAGTNGKGSTTAYLRAIAEAAGLRVHVLTSPHLVRFAERIRVAGRLLAESDLSQLVDRIVDANGDEPISFNEILTAMAIEAFAREPADLCVVEVGLGGRFDSTNVIDSPAVSVITPIAYDHLELLGPTIGNIAWEKAGIIKANRPVVSARQESEVLEVIAREAAILNAPLTVLGHDYGFRVSDGRLLVTTPDRRLDLPAPGLKGPHQFANAALAVIAALALQDPRLDDAALSNGVARVVWPARFQPLTRGPLAKMAHARDAQIWLDGGHNPHAGQALADTCAEIHRADARPWALICAMYARKDAIGFFEAFLKLRPSVLTTIFAGENVSPAEELASSARSLGLMAEPAASVRDALQRALAGPGPAPNILICGGLHFAGEVLGMNRETWPD